MDKSDMKKDRKELSFKNTKNTLFDKNHDDFMKTLLDYVHNEDSQDAKDVEEWAKNEGLSK